MARSNPNLGRWRSLLAIGALSSLCAGCSGAPLIRIDAAEARTSPMLQGVCSVFMKISNPGDGDDALVEARADVPGAVTQIHAVRDGRMVQREKLVVPAGGVLELKPGGLHIMVFNLPKDGGAGYEFTLHLRFQRSGERRTTVRIVG
ncbi:MAG TPA: copper chaperone PCu(A)C [Anaeromyxobacter sp.]|nr:copper chaperone PCu(A)C [Anaeromyxobacter sp.]